MSKLKPQTSPRRRKPAPPKQAPPAEAQIYLFDIRKAGVPAQAIITVHAPTYREAVAAAYLLTETFTTDAIEFLKQ